MDPVLKNIFDGILGGASEAVEANTWAALQRGLAVQVILDEGMIKAMTEVGSSFERGEFYLPEMLISARAMQAGLVILKPYLENAKIKARGKVAIGTVKGDLHDIGKNLVAMMLEGAGFEIIDLGTDVAPEKFVAVADRVDVIALSALLTTTMLNMEATIEALQKSGKRKMVKVIIGGAPITETYAQQIGADGYAPDASRAVAVTKALLDK